MDSEVTMHLLVLLMSLGATPDAEVTRELSASTSGVVLSAVPQLGLARAEGLVGFGRLGLELAGWGVFLPETQGFHRGGWFGGRFEALETDAVRIEASVRVFMAQPGPGTNAVAGIGGVARSRIAVFPWLSLQPDFDLTSLGSLVTARLANEVVLRSGDWRLGLCGGGQLWARDAIVSAAFAASLSLRWHHQFGATGLAIAGSVAVARDPSFLLKQPVLQVPNDQMALWAAVSVAVLGAESWGAF